MNISITEAIRILQRRMKDAYGEDRKAFQLAIDILKEREEPKRCNYWYGRAVAE